MIKRPNTKAQRLRRHKRVRGKIAGTPERPRLNVFRSESNIYAQIIDDTKGVTLVSASSLEKDFACEGTKSDAAKQVVVDAGCEVYVPTAEELAAFQEACQPVYSQVVTEGICTEAELAEMLAIVAAVRGD